MPTVVGKVSFAPRIKPNIKLFPAKKLGLPDYYKSPWVARKYDIHVYKFNNEIIWGLTARFVNNFIQILKNNT